MYIICNKILLLIWNGITSGGEGSSSGSSHTHVCSYIWCRSQNLGGILFRLTPQAIAQRKYKPGDWTIPNRPLILTWDEIGKLEGSGQLLSPPVLMCCGPFFRVLLHLICQHTPSRILYTLPNTESSSICR